MAFLSLLLYIAAVYLRPQEWVAVLSGFPLIFILTISTSIFAFLDSFSRRKGHLVEGPNLMIVLFLGSILMSHITHTYLQGAIDSFNAFAPNLILFFLLVNILCSERKIKIAIWFIIILTFILAIEGIQQFYSGVGWAGQSPFIDTVRGVPRIRWVGIFNDPNDLALIFVIAIGFLISLFFEIRGLRTRSICTAMIIVIGHALFCTNSRGGFLAMGATLAFFILRKVKNKLFALSLGGGLIFLIILLGPSRMSVLSASEASAYGRIEAWYNGFQMLKSAPMFGVGYGLFMEHYSMVAHNSFINVAAELGLIGLFTWVALIYKCFNGLFPVARKNISLRPYLLGLEGGLVGFLSASFFLSRSYIMVLYILLGLAASAMYENLKSEECGFSKHDWFMAIFMTIGILVLIWISMKFSL